MLFEEWRYSGAQGNGRGGAAIGDRGPAEKEKGDPHEAGRQER